jgi:hypothetical protein
LRAASAALAACKKHFVICYDEFKREALIALTLERFNFVELGRV